MSDTSDSKLLNMLTGYAAAHQHPFNITVHLIGIPIIMLGVSIPLTWTGFEINNLSINLAHVDQCSFIERPRIDTGVGSFDASR